MDKRLPIVRVVKDMANGTFAFDAGHSPVVADAVAWLSFLFGERLVRSADKTAMAGEEHAGVPRLTTELIRDIG